MTAIYRGVRFASRTASQWAAFFDRAGLKWRARPITIAHWSPDFSVTTASGATFAYVHVLDARDAKAIREQVDDLGIPTDMGSLLLVGRRPLTATVIGLFGSPRKGWQPALGAAWGLRGHLQQRWQGLFPKPYAPLPDPPGTASFGALGEVYAAGDAEILPTWRERAESFARYWAADRGTVRDWGLCMQRLADLDEFAAGSLMGATRAELGATRLEIDMADPSLRAAFCRQYTSRFTNAVQEALGLQLVVRYRPWRVA